ncbi:MAG: chromate transporter, partial [Christensenellaceae bacterium]|nr:chromate transporter [Christensenellaceae bacterium]
EITIIASAFKGIKLAVGLLILDAAIKMIKKMKKNAFSRTILLCSFIAMLLINIFSWNFSTISLILIAALIGLFVFNISKKGGVRA